ncbi:MAG: PQQ-dependent sugar dehydrogenase [Planctomycetota bacterium]
MVYRSCLVRVTLKVALGCLLAWWIAPTPAHADFNVNEVWSQQCARCHGDDGAGANATSLLDDEWLSDGTDRGLFLATKEGQPDFGMPAYGETLADEEIWALTNHIYELRERDRKKREPAPTPGADGVIDSQHERYRIETMIEDGLETPWSVAALPDGRWVVAEKPGRLRVWDGQDLSPPVRGIPDVRDRGQGGLLDIEPHPDYADNGWLYLSFADPQRVDGQGLGMTKVVRGKITSGRWVDQQTIWEVPESQYARGHVHYGCRLVFDGQGYLFIAIGDRGRRDPAQDLAAPEGKVHRVNDDGSIPQDNPFVDTPGAMASTWSYGHRNPQGMVFDPDAGALWITEHGPRGGDELNRIDPGANYGWPIVSHGINYNGRSFVTPWPDEDDPPGMIPPTMRWLPSIAVCGLDRGDGQAFPGWEGDLFAGGLVGQVVERLRVRDGRVVEREEIVRNLGRVRDVVTAPDGSIVVVLNGPNKVVRLVPAGAAE